MIRCILLESVRVCDCTYLVYPLMMVEFFRAKLSLKLSFLGGIQRIEEV
jgi:hypothetical protein